MAEHAQFNYPRGIFVRNNEIFIADTSNHRIRKITYRNKVITIAGNGEGGYNGDGMKAIDAKLNSPSCLVVGVDGSVYFSDSENHRIRKVDSKGMISTVAGCGTPGDSGDGNLAIKAKLSNPRGICLSNHGDYLYIADKDNNAIKRVSLINGIIETVTRDVKTPWGIAISIDDVIYISEYANRTIKTIGKNMKINKIAGLEGKYGYEGEDKKAESSLLNEPAGLCLDESGNLYFADRDNNHIRKINRKSGLINSIVKDGLKKPLDCCLFNDEVLIADTNNHQIKKLTKNGGVITIAGTGQGYSGDSDLKEMSLHLQKFERDKLFNTEIIGFVPLLRKLSPKFTKTILTNEKLLNKMNHIQHSIIQNLIDETIYGAAPYIVSSNIEDNLNLISIIGLFEEIEFYDYKVQSIQSISDSVNLTTVTSILEQIEMFIEKEKSPNNLLQKLHQYCIEFIAIQLRSDSTTVYLLDQPIVLKNQLSILRNVSLKNTRPLTISNSTNESGSVSDLFDDSITSDLKIHLQNSKIIRCHKTILSSHSIFFLGLLNKDKNFGDYNSGNFYAETIEGSNDELLEIVIKYCYELFEGTSNDNLIPLINVAIMHEINFLIDYAQQHLTIDTANYFTLVDQLRHFMSVPHFESVFNKLKKFGVANRKALFTTIEKVADLPEELRISILFESSQL